MRSDFFNPVVSTLCNWANFIKVLRGKLFNLLISSKSSCKIFSFLVRLDSLSFFNSLAIDWFCLFWMFLYISCFKLFNFCLWWYLYISSVNLACFFLWISLNSVFIMFYIESSSFMSMFLIVKRCLRSFLLK